MQSPVHRSVPVGPWSVWVLPRSASVSDQELHSGLGSSTQSILMQSSHEGRIQDVLRSRWLFRACYGLADPERGTDGELLWPQDVCGSLSHKKGHVAVLSLTRGTYHSLGVDLEQVEVPERVATKVLTAEESFLLSGIGTRTRFGAAAFAAKEAIFKAVFPLGRERFWFEDATIVGMHPVLVANNETFRLEAQIGSRAGGPEAWTRQCSVDVTFLTIDGEDYWLAVCGIANASLNLIR